MREIKFRFWDAREKQFCGDIWTLDGILDKSPVIVYRSDESFIPLQYIGLVDKNGKEIYEGDIVWAAWDLEKNYLDKVIWMDGKGEWLGGTIGFCYQSLNWWNDETQDITTSYTDEKGYFIDVEILGNIYENRELIPKKD